MYYQETEIVVILFSLAKFIFTYLSFCSNSLKKSCDYM